MFRHDLNQTEFVDFLMPFGGRLSSKNRWVKLAKIIPWNEIEEIYRQSFKDTKMGAPAKSGRIAFGALIIKERLGITDEETVDQIFENPYLQFFLGLHEFSEKALFAPSMMVYFRSRFSQEDFEKINTTIIARASSDLATLENHPSSEDRPDPDPPKSSSSGQFDDSNAPDDDSSEVMCHAGKLLIDATCTPADITYPTDLKLLGEARTKLEGYLDLLHKPYVGQFSKPRTYRQKARRQFLAIAKQKKPGIKKIRKAIGQQLRYLKRDLGHIDQYLKIEPQCLARLTTYELKCLQVIGTLYEQQKLMYEKRKRSVEDRIVSISQPHVRPIIRGKTAKPVEFGAKVSISHFEGGFVTLHRLSWDAYHEGEDLIAQIEDYHRRFGFYPESVHADMIYRTRANRAYCTEKGIRLSGPALGRPRKVTTENTKEIENRKKQTRQDELDRIPVEGKFGNAKRKGTLERIKAKLAHTSVSVISIGLIVLNLDTWLRRHLRHLLLGLKLGLISLQESARGWRSALKIHRIYLRISASGNLVFSEN